MIFVIAKLIVIIMSVETMNAYYFNIIMIFLFYIFSPIKKRIYIFYCSNFIAIYFIRLIKMENK
jgi:hypothetical protein